MAIALTDSAAQRVKDYLAASDSKNSIRLTVTETGCSGYAYVLDLVDTPAENDSEFESSGVKIYVDDDAMKIVDGTTIDFKSEGLNQMFTFKNPKETGSCGCGESFTV